MLFIAIIKRMDISLNWILFIPYVNIKYTTMKAIKITLSLIFSILYINSFGQLTIGAQIRPRAEFRNGFKTLTTKERNPAFFIEQRSRFFADYNSDKFEVKINFQDVRIWGSTDQIYKSETGTLTNIYEAWGLYRLNRNWQFKIGRMDLDYNNARFLGDLDWAAQGRSHDALVISYKTDSSDFRLDIGGAFNQSGFEPTKLSETFYTGLNNYKTMQFIWVNKKFNNSEISAIIHNDGQQIQSDSSIAFRQTYGLMASGKLNKFNFTAEAYVQSGKNAAENDVNAYMLSASLSIPTQLTPITFGFDMLSGSSINDINDKSFNPLYGTNHKFYGFMDYFYVGNTHGQQGKVAGLIDIFLKTKFKVNTNSNLVAHTHIFNSAADIYNPENLTSSVSKYLGTELDIVYNYTFDKDVVLNIGYSQMLAGESMEYIKAAAGDHEAFNNWVWLMISFHPKVVLNK